ncbi:CheR family methyltransferase [Timonella senegalensis]|uniref:CheR family methyltransferase n=1 Tax=Timonella senegalensis TaxID=1465825 RepID=UPI0028AD4BF2|nr:protein-glutamate O-methyltransferase CheR [Timonella senegalensis]
MTITHDNFTYIADLVRRKSAIVLGPGKEYLVEARLTPIARDRMLSLDRYVESVRARLNPAEHELIVEALTTNETSWYRDAQPFSALTGHIVPELRKERRILPGLRVWSAACSTGQEPYSIAMTLKEHFGGPSWTGPVPLVDILATDLSQQVLDRSEQGRYTQLEINRGLPAHQLVRYFSRHGTEWELSPEIRSMVRFQRHNLLDTVPPGGPFDVVFLRNVLIYFDVHTKLEVLRKVRSALRPGGFLILGAAETTVGLDDSWLRVPFGRSSIYQKVANA